MSPKNKNRSVIALCVQEPHEDGSQMDLGLIKGDDLKFLHQAFITDTISNALEANCADVRLYSIDVPERRRFVKIVTEYLGSRLTGVGAEGFKNRFEKFEQPHERWGLRLQGIFSECFKAGYRSVLVLGSRTPTITTGRMLQALTTLNQVDAVFGPTPEGRYYMIGMTGSPAIDLSEFDWRSPSIYSEVSTAFDSKELSWSELEIWYAVESLDELEVMARDINQYRFEGDENTARETEIVVARLLNKLEL